VFGAHRTQLPQFFATSPNVATLLACRAVRSVRNVQIASQHKMMRIQMAFFLWKSSNCSYNTSVASFAPGPKCFIQHLHRPTAPVQTLTLRTVGRTALTVETTLLPGQMDRQTDVAIWTSRMEPFRRNCRTARVSEQAAPHCTPRTRIQVDGIITLFDNCRLSLLANCDNRQLPQKRY